VPLLRSVCALTLFMVFAVAVSHAQDKKTFPTDDEINLLLIQADRAMQQYKPLIDEEEAAFGKSGAQAIAKDREVVNAIEVGVKTLRKNLQGFNGPAGFLFFQWLDDAHRNALLCANGAVSQSAIAAMTKNIDKANELLNLERKCLDVSVLIYTVSENAGALYTRYVEAEQALATQEYAVAQKCVEALKKMDSRQKK
jgi:hypothetical protein